MSSKDKELLKLFIKNKIIGKIWFRTE